ncbi:Hypothetical protein LUCI_2629 [Lucifera butyrica]|uniref:CASTOR ACT domain-containing protein n=1 Tax=Lucifera butyrica TaxID=1351585 RepID=A0A498R8S0_9FIRM|nr:ACT domain-containing protein [Lucifera butyrica]VBB07385.1 Hypothetical protein LUCI_2629 [Lucifera butyrica]
MQFQAQKLKERLRPITPAAWQEKMSKNGKTKQDETLMIMARPGSETENDNDVIDRLPIHVSCIPSITRMSISFDPGQGAGEISRLLKELADSSISMDLVNVHPQQVVFTVDNPLAAKTQSRIRKWGYRFESIPDCAQVVISGGQSDETPYVLSGIAEALAGSNIDVLQIAGSCTGFSVLIRETDMEQTVKVLQEKLFSGIR